MKLSKFDYSLPKELIAQFPLERREASRLLVIERNSQKISHKTFPDIVDYFSSGDTVVLNDTKVIPARLFGLREKTRGKAEIFLLEKLSKDTFKALLNPAGKIDSGEKIIFFKNNFSAQIMEKDVEGFRIIKFWPNGNLEKKLEEIGKIPLPPYIKREIQPSDKERYQTVYAKKEGAVAAPTAGLHFSQDLLRQILRKGINIAYVTLHVNYATFKPVKEENIERHKMYKEYYEFPEETAKVIAQTKAKGKRVLAVGTTSCRVLETIANSMQSAIRPSTSLRASNPQSAIIPYLKVHHGWTDLFIYPPYAFKLTDILLTNFHFPRSTLLMVVAAFCGSDIWKKAYQEAIEQRYRFYSYGDAMLII